MKLHPSVRKFLNASPRSVDTIVKSLNDTVEELKSTASHHHTEAVVLQAQVDAHRNEAARADRIAGKFSSLIS